MKNKTGEMTSGKKYIEVPVKRSAPIWAAGCVWILCALVLPMYKLPVIILTAVLSLLVFMILSKLLPKKTIRKAVPFTSGDPELDEIVNRIDDSAEAIDAASKKIYAVKPDIADCMSVIISYILKIRGVVVDSPEDVKKISRFLNYYLPTTVKISEKYVYLTSQRSAGANVSEAIDAMEKAFIQIRDAFMKQHDALFADDALDITTDITVLETLLKQDSLNK